MRIIKGVRQRSNSALGARVAYCRLMAWPQHFIAIVDDEECVRRALERLLRVSQFEVKAFPSGQSFLDSLSSRRPDCLVLDIQMAGLTGRDVQSQLAEAEIHIPIIFITAYDEPTTRDQCLADGAFEYFCKPLSGDKLISTIHAAIAQLST
jgi:FixJ family two-component response regulator